MRKSVMRLPAFLPAAAMIAAVLALASGCAANESSSASSSSAQTRPSAAATRAASEFAVPAVREPLTTNVGSPVVHDTETNAIVAHSGHLFAATDQWEYAGPSPAGQVLVKRSAKSGWAVFEQAQSLRVQALDSFAIPKDQGIGAGHSLLVTQAIVHSRSEVQWLLDGATSFAPSDAYALSSTRANVRAFGAHEAGGVWAVYAGVRPTGILRGTWSPTKHTLVFDPHPELAVGPPGSAGFVTQKVTGFADCSGALYASINTKLFRRNDGNLPPGAARWVLVYQAPPVGPHNSGLRGLTCLTRNGSKSLLVSTEGNGKVYRLDHLPSGQLDQTAIPRAGRLPDGIVATLEFSPIPAIRTMLAAHGTTVPATGTGSIAYVIAAYNNGGFQTINVGGDSHQAFGFEWAYAGHCPTTRTCGPTALRSATFDAAACFAVRTDRAPSPSYTVHCLSGPDFAPSDHVDTPIRSGQAFVSIRTITPSPFGDGRLYYGGYDCNFYPADGTAWIAASAPYAL
jgi:hypothetical protein